MFLHSEVLFQCEFKVLRPHVFVFSIIRIDRFLSSLSCDIAYSQYL